MSQRLRIDIISPPFGGHLHPQLDLATRIHQAAEADIRILSTPSAKQASELTGLPFIALLANRENKILGIANAPKQVGSNPIRLIGQLRDNLSLMDQLIRELEEQWTASPPDLVIADFAVPIAGLLAQRLGIPWWTAMRAPTVIDTPDGIPPYMGGLQPQPGYLGGMRDSLGRTLIRAFKRSVHFVFRKSMRRIGLPTVYREDGYERIYSPTRILVQGVLELEFPCTWPPSARFIGPLTASPRFPHEPPPFQLGKPHVLISLGTHVRWAQRHAVELMEQVAQRMPHVEFHFTRGRVDLDSQISKASNFQTISYLPYDEYMHRYSATIQHTGSGIMYSSLRAGVPILAWPQDFDQFDNTARLLHHQLAIRCTPNPASIESDLKRLITDPTLRSNVQSMQATIHSYNSTQLISELLQEEFQEIAASRCRKIANHENPLENQQGVTR